MTHTEYLIQAKLDSYTENAKKNAEIMLRRYVARKIEQGFYQIPIPDFLQNEWTRMLFLTPQLIQAAKRLGFAVVKTEENRFFIDIENSKLDTELQWLTEFQPYEKIKLLETLRTHYFANSLFSIYLLKDYRFENIATEDFEQLTKKQKQVIAFLTENGYGFHLKAKEGLKVFIPKDQVEKLAKEKIA